MESCLLCLEVNKNLLDSIKTNSALWLEYHVAELIEKYFWPLNSRLTPLNSSLCLLCWQELNSFHKFYMRVEEAHINFGRPIKVSEISPIIEEAIGMDNEDDKEFIQCGLLESDILIDKPSDKEEIEILFNIKTEPQDVNLIDVPIEDTSKLLDTEDSMSNKDLLEKLIKPKNTPSKNKRKMETKSSNKTLSKAPKEDTIEIKKEKHDNDSDSESKDNADNIEQADPRDSDNSFQNDNDQSEVDPQQNMENKKRKTYHKHRTNCNENDEFISKNLKGIVCDLCKTEFDTFAGLRKHFAGIHKQRGYLVCCNKKFFNSILLVDHIHSHLNPDHFKCKQCDRVMSDRLRLENHMLRFHGATELEKKYCDVCQKPFIEGYKLRCHKLTHLPDEEKKFPCEECGKFYATAYALKVHKEGVHLKKLPKFRSICGKSSASIADYKVRMNKHKGIPAPDISCNICGLRLTSEKGLKKHKESQHPVGGKKDHPCPICHKISPTVTALKKHINYMHEKGYDHKCTICGKAFKRPDYLKDHMALHTGMALYPCPSCPKAFRSNRHMNSHRKSIHPKEWEEEKLKKYSSILPKHLQLTKQSN